MTKKARAPALCALLLFAAACVQLGLPEGATAEHRYFAAVADYTTAKVAAAKYASAPETPVAQIEAILRVVDDGDRYIHAVDAVRRGECSDPTLARVLPALAGGDCALADGDYAGAAGALRVTSSILRRLATEEE